MENKLAVIVKESGLSKTRAQVLLDNFSDYFQVASEWEAKAMDIVVVSPDQKAEMKIARVGRLFLRQKRIQIEKTRKELKEQPLREGKAIDGIANVLKWLFVPIEKYLEKQEKFVEIKTAEIAELARVETERKAEEDRLAGEKADRKEQERIGAENERLQKEALAKEKSLRAERKKAAAKQKEIFEKVRLEREKMQAERVAREEKVRLKMAEIERKARVAKERAEAERIEKLEAIAQAGLDRELAKKTEAKQQAKLEAEKKEREKMQASLAAQVERQVQCPFCHKKFIPERSK